MQDFRYAARGLVRRPGFTAAAVVTLAIGIGGTTAIFSAVNALLMRRLPYSAPEQLMTVSLTMPTIGGLRARDDMVWSYPKYVVFRDAQTIFSHTALYSHQPFTVTTGEAMRVDGEFVSAGYLRTLGLSVERGRDFDSGIEAHAGAARQVIISHSLWKRRYAGNSDVVGKLLELDRLPYVVIGIAPAGFRGLTGQSEVFVPITTRPADELDERQAQNHEFFMVARRKSGIGVEAATEAVKLLGARVRDAFIEQESDREWGATARPLNDVRVSAVIRRSLIVALSAMGFVLLIACVNVANLLLGLASIRQREIAVRLALGARRRRLVRMLLTESMLLAALGGAAGLAIAWLCARALRTVDPERLVTRGNDTLRALGAVTFSGVHVDWAALIVAATTTLMVGFGFGLVPAIQATSPSLTNAMNVAAGEGARRGGLLGGRRALVIVEVALAMVLLVGSGLLMRSFVKLTRVDPGFDAKNVLTLRLTIPPGEMADDAMPGFYASVLDRLRTLPAIADASLNSCPPLGGGCYRTPLELLDAPGSRDARPRGVRVSWVTPTWFATVRVPLERGRLFTSSDRNGSPKVALINAAAARTFWPGMSPIGKRVGINGETANVIGVVGDVRQFVDSLAQPDVYLPYAQSPSSHAMLFVRGSVAPAVLSRDVVRTIRALAPRVAIYDIRPMAARAAAATAQSRFTTVLLGLFAATAFSLAVVGIYGVMSFIMTMRTREIGIRITLGADPSRLRRQMVGEGVALVSLGLLIGVAGAVACTRILQKLLFDLSATDPVTYCAIAMLFGLAAACASWLPARRASNMNPVVALRAD